MKKLRRPSQKVITLTAREITRIKKEISDRTLTLITAYLMDELDYDEDKIIELWEGITRYSEAIKDHSITLNKVKDIIQEKTGIVLKGWKSGAR